MNALETTLPYFNDMTMVLEEAGLMPGSGKYDERASQMRELAFRVGSGRAKHRFGERPMPAVRLVYVLSTNEPLSKLVGRGRSAEAEAVADRLITLPLVEGRPFGIFDNCPPSYPSVAAFADALKREASEHFGHAVPAFLQYVVDRREREPNWLDRTLQRRLNRFTKAAGIDTNNGSEVRVGLAFGLVYVAGLIAKWAGVLPATPSYRAAISSSGLVDLCPLFLAASTHGKQLDKV